MEYLDAILCGYARYYLDVRRVYRNQRSGWGLGELPVKALVCAPRRLTHQHPARPFPHVLVSVQIAPGNVDQRIHARPYSTDSIKELVLSFEHVERLVLPVLDMRRRSIPGLRGDLEERVRPAGSIAGDLARHHLVHNPQ